MPSSFHDALAVVLPFVIGIEPKSILDVGIGFGKYGVLFREYLDVARPSDPGAPFDPTRRTTRIDGIEAHAPYVTPLQRAVYDTIHIGGALELLPTLGRYDLVFAADLLEHLTRDDGRAFLALSLARVNLGVLLVMPALDFEQGAVFGNAYEIHRSSWAPADFAPYPDADVLTWRRQLLVWLPSDGVRRVLPRPTLREALGLAARACLVRVLGGLRSEAWLDEHWRRRT
ncbi:MAG: hypothetical protein A2050_14300 [Candidatus Rokubacteria bacterium GWA2_73_35]|nr:MAG: hypothetical protein A2050_14300 [Candidatus Rokubacteria bacterium GWA2_73_35]